MSKRSNIRELREKVEQKGERDAIHTLTLFVHYKGKSVEDEVAPSAKSHKCECFIP